MIILITGATAGFGRAFVKKFICEGHRVIAIGRRSDRLEVLAQEFQDQIIVVPLDVSKKDEVEKKLSGLPPSWQEIDVLINNAGMALGTLSAQQSHLQDWEQMVDTNIKGVMYCTHALLPGMVKRNRGHIVNIGSVAGEFPYPGGNVYGATKAFVHQFSLNLRADLIGTAVRVTSLEPGMCGGTEFSEVRLKGDKKKAAAVYAGVDYLTPEDIADTVYWIVNRPAHVNINTISLMPVQQSFGSWAIHRKTD
jgi:3-hydroxy acid dehydrogenase/malonic semialdehyde reductase